MYDDKNKEDDYQDTLTEAQKKVTDYDSQILQAIKSRDKEAIKELTQAKQQAMDELNKTIQDHEREAVSSKFDDESKKLDDQLKDLTKPESMTKLISDAMKSGVINVNGEVIKLSDAMDNFLKNSVSGVQTLKSEMTDLVNTINDGVSALSNAGLLNSVKSSTLDTSTFTGVALNPLVTTIVPSNIKTSQNVTLKVDSPLVHIDKVDSGSIDEVANIVESKFNGMAKELMDNFYT